MRPMFTFLIFDTEEGNEFPYTVIIENRTRVTPYSLIEALVIAMAPHRFVQNKKKLKTDFN